MRLLLLCIFCLIILSCSKEEIRPPKPISGNLPLIIIVGQSNAEGYAPFTTAPLWLVNNHYEIENYFIWDKTRTVFDHYILGQNVGSENNSDSRFGFDIFFAKNYLETYGNKLLCIKQAVGGVPISEKGSGRIARWTPNVNLIPLGERRMIEELSDKITKAKIYAKQNNAALIPIAILYVQGEADANEKVRLDDYKTNFTSLVVYLRQLLNNEELPIINAEIMYVNSNYMKVNSIYQEFHTNDPYIKTVNMSKNQTSIGDNMHYDASAFEFMGNKMFEYYQEINTEKPH